jgi:hypothetical protein
VPRSGHSPEHGWYGVGSSPKTYSPDDPTLQEYWRQRRSRPRTLAHRPRQLTNRQRGHCPVPPQGRENGEDLHVHPVVPSNVAARTSSPICGWSMGTAIASFTAPVHLLRYVDGMSRVLGDGYPQFCGGGVTVTSSRCPTEYEHTRRPHPHTDKGVQEFRQMLGVVSQPIVDLPQLAGVSRNPQG